MMRWWVQGVGESTPLRGHCQFSFAVSGQAGLRESEIVRLSAGMVRGMNSLGPTAAVDRRRLQTSPRAWVDTLIAEQGESELVGHSAGIGRVGESTPLRGHCQASN